MLRFEQSCLRLDVRQCDTSRPDDKTRILRAVRGEGREGVYSTLGGSGPVPAYQRSDISMLLITSPHHFCSPSLTLTPCIDQGQRGCQAHDQGGLGDAGPLLQVRKSLVVDLRALSTLGKKHWSTPPGQSCCCFTLLDGHTSLHQLRLRPPNARLSITILPPINSGSQGSSSVQQRGQEHG